MIVGEAGGNLTLARGSETGATLVTAGLSSLSRLTLAMLEVKSPISIYI